MAGQEPGPRPAWLSVVTECWAWRGSLHLWDLHILCWGGVSSFPIRRPFGVPMLEGLNKASPAKGQSLLPTTAPEARAVGRACGESSGHACTWFHESQWGGRVHGPRPCPLGCRHSSSCAEKAQLHGDGRRSPARGAGSWEGLSS